jgi:hypothetical protein
VIHVTFKMLRVKPGHQSQDEGSASAFVFASLHVPRIWPKASVSVAARQVGPPPGKADSGHWPKTRQIFFEVNSLLTKTPRHPLGGGRREGLSEWGDPFSSQVSVDSFAEFGVPPKAGNFYGRLLVRVGPIPNLLVRTE